MIYSFHMPAFLFLSGMFARFDRIHYIFGLALPYLLLQTLYTSFVHALGIPMCMWSFPGPSGCSSCAARPARSSSCLLWRPPA